MVTPREAGGFGIDAQWSDDFHHALFTVLAPAERQGYYADFGSLGQLAKALEKTFVYDGIYSRYRKRIHGKPPTRLSQHRFLGYIQNHDQVGNRAMGDRISHIAGLERAKIAAALVLTSPFVPMLFQGEEWAASTPFQYFADHERSRAGSRRFRRAKARVCGVSAGTPLRFPTRRIRRPSRHRSSNGKKSRQPGHAEMLAWYRALIRLRRSTPCLNDGAPGKTRVTYDEEEKWLRMERGTIGVICNLGEMDQLIPHSARRRRPSCIAAGIAAREEDAIVLPPDTVAVIAGLQQSDQKCRIVLLEAEPTIAECARARRYVPRWLSSERLTRSREPSPTASARVRTMPPKRMPNASSTMFPPTSR